LYHLITLFVESNSTPYHLLIIFTHMFGKYVFSLCLS
jgi:hypothetical protein